MAVTQKEKLLIIFPLSLPFSQRPSETQLQLNALGLLLIAWRENMPWGTMGHPCTKEKLVEFGLTLPALGETGP